MGRFPKPFAAGGEGGAGSLTLDEAIGHLLTEPYNKSFHEIASYTDWQIVNLLFRPRDEEGHFVRSPFGTAASPDGVGSLESTCKQVWRERGESEEEIAAHWQRYCQANGIPVNHA